MPANINVIKKPCKIVFQSNLCGLVEIEIRATFTFFKKKFFFSDTQLPYSILQQLAKLQFSYMTCQINKRNWNGQGKSFFTCCLNWNQLSCFIKIDLLGKTVKLMGRRFWFPIQILIVVFCAIKFEHLKSVFFIIIIAICSCKINGVALKAHKNCCAKQWIFTHKF